ncbi:MAG: hypothetical protein D4R67_01005 [Bacteroidetes bacterium]|nr:MAG: hypothetical protein D4R67_01005 [Bacteroidota bacterium]
MSNIIAVIFDFDDTLVPDSTSLLLEKFGVDTRRFWKDAYSKLVTKGYDPTLAYLKLLLDLVGEGKPLGMLSNQELNEFGKTLDTMFYPGIPELFDDLRKIVRNINELIAIEFYIITGGLHAIISGSNIVNDNFYGFYGCTLDEEGDPPRLTSIKRAITFTEKTRYIFEINKGIRYRDALVDPFAINTFIPHSERRIPIENMIYLGDGYNDIPCFSLLAAHRAASFGVFSPEDNKKAQHSFIDMVQYHRVQSIHIPDYKEDKDLGSLLRLAVSTLASSISLRLQSGYVR